MPRYIDAEIFGFIHFKDRPDKTYADGIQRVMAFVDSLPSADVRENVRGNWIEKEVIDDRKDAKIPQWQQAQCSICGKWNTTPYMYYFDEFDFCPNCGADMRGEEK